MRRLLPLALLCVAAFGPACGGDDSSGGPLESALSYVPEQAPFVVAIDTDLEGGQYSSLQAILDRFPGGIELEGLLEGELEGGAGDVSYEKDVKPMLGNPFVVSATDVTSFVDDSEDDDFVASLQVKDSDALDRVIDKTEPEEQGEVAGATVYEDDGSFFAVEEDVVVLAGSRKLLDAALERADGDDHLDTATFEAALEGLPDEALARIYFDLQALIAQDPDTEAARKVAWVAALRTLGMTAAVEEDAIDIEFNLRTDSEGLSDEDLPLAAGDEAPAIVKRDRRVRLWPTRSEPGDRLLRGRAAGRRAAGLRRLRNRQAGDLAAARHRRRQGPDRPADRRPVGIGRARRLVRRARRGRGPRRVRADRRQGRREAAAARVGAGRDRRATRG